MDAGRFDRKIVIKNFTVAKNTTGEDVKTFATYHSCSAAIIYKGGGEKFEAEQDTATNFIDFMIRYKSGITEDMKITYASNDYDIVHIEEMQRRKYLKIKAKKKY